MKDNDDYIINMLALQLNKAIDAYIEDYTDCEGYITQLGRQVKEYCNKQHIRYE